MATLVLNRQSVSVKLEENHLVIHEHAQGGSFTRMPLVDVERVIVVGQPAITFPVLAKFLDLGIPCLFLTRSGRWRGLMDGDLDRKSWMPLSSDRGIPWGHSVQK